jgi:formyl-CoA transferase
LSIGDSLGGLFTAQGVLAALVARQRTGRGQVVDTALTDACLAVTESMVPDYDLAGVVRARTGPTLDGIAPSNAYTAADGVLVLVAANQDSVFRRLCSAMSRPELADDPRFRDHVSRGRNQDAIDGIVAEWVGARTAAQVMTCLRGAGVVCGPINTVAEVVESEQFRARQMVLPHLDLALGRSVLGPGIVPKLSATPGSVYRPAPPEPGCDNAEVYGDLLGLGREELADLREQGVI